MTPMEILEALKKLPTAERLTIIEAALRLTREGSQHREQRLTPAERKQRLAAAAEALLTDSESSLTGNIVPALARSCS